MELKIATQRLAAKANADALRMAVTAAKTEVPVVILSFPAILLHCISHIPAGRAAQKKAMLMQMTFAMQLGPARAFVADSLGLRSLGIMKAGVVQKQGQARTQGSKTAPRGRRPQGPVPPEQAAELEEGERSRQLQKALQLVMRLEDALGTFSANVVRRAKVFCGGCAPEKPVDLLHPT